MFVLPLNKSYENNRNQQWIRLTNSHPQRFVMTERCGLGGKKKIFTWTICLGTFLFF